MTEKLAQALDYISGRHIDEAAAFKRRRRPVFLGAVAAILAVALLLNLPSLPMTVNARVVAEASGSLKPERPDRDDYENFSDFEIVRDQYDALLDSWQAGAAAALENATPFFARTSADYLGNAGSSNRVFSPANAYLALAALAELTDGDSRAQILQALDAPDLETLRFQAGAVWEEVYWDRNGKGGEVVKPATSLWLDNALSYNQEVMDTLGQAYHTDVFQTDLGSSRAGKALGAWINNNTGGLLKQSTAQADFPEIPVVTLVSTIFFQAKWSDQFSPAKNTRDVFHAPDGDIDVTYMNKKELETHYYWGESFGAVSLWLKNNCKMWLFLPDAGKTVDDVLAEGEYLSVMRPSENYREELGENFKYMKVNLTMPKFDIASSGDLAEVFQRAGITDVFDLGHSNFTAITGDSPVYLTGANQATRVMVDEEGVKAATYIELPGAGAAEPPEEIIDFILDRPFVFVVADTSGIPLFSGVVNHP